MGNVVKLGCGCDRRAQENAPSIHGETDAFRKVGQQTNYRDKILVTTFVQCWYCSGLIHQFNIGSVTVAESVNVFGHFSYLKDAGVTVVGLYDERCITLMTKFIGQSPGIWFEDIGECNSH
jgi:cytosine deaminase